MFSALDRAAMIGASDVNIFMTERSPEDLLRWYEVKIGLRDPDPQTFAMRLGAAVGDLILDEYERQTKQAVTRRQEVVPSPLNKRFRATLDGFRQDDRAVVESKFCSPYIQREQLFLNYYPQVAFQMHCCDVEHGYLVIGQGTNEPIEIECVRSAKYESELLSRCNAMLLCIDTLTPPVTLPAPVPPEKWRTIDLTGDDRPNWASELFAALVEYDETAAAADAHDAFGKLARSMVPGDVGKVISLNHVISRNKKGVLAITRRAA